MDLFISVVALGLLMFSSMEKLEAQGEVSSSAMSVVLTKNLPNKECSLDLIPFEGDDVNLAKCHETDDQTIHLLPGQKLVVTINKKCLFYQQEGGKVKSGTNYNIQNSLTIDDWDGYENWMFDCAPFEWTNSIFSNFYNNYFYQAGNHSGKATLFFISQTYPRYYSSLQVIID